MAGVYTIITVKKEPRQKNVTRLNRFQQLIPRYCHAFNMSQQTPRHSPMILFLRMERMHVSCCCMKFDAHVYLPIQPRISTEAKLNICYILDTTCVIISRLKK